MRVKVIGYWLLVIGCLSLTACHNNIEYSRFHSIPSGEWAVDSVMEFPFKVVHTEPAYSMIIYVRHTERYPYQNMWLFVDNGPRRDTIEFYLADDRGQWLGDHHNGFIEMPVLLEQNYHFKDTGTHHMTIQHGMRDSVLRGITDIGL
jgi:gliding motility-associated lipoprotein GldH